MKYLSVQFGILLFLCGICQIYSQPNASAQQMSSAAEEVEVVGNASKATGELGGSTLGYDSVREVLRKRCVTCHNLDEMRGDLNLADMAGIRAGSASGPVVVAGQANQSLFFKTAAHLEDPVMPPNSQPIPARELDIIRRWIDGGLAEKSGDQPVVAEQRSEPDVSAGSGLPESMSNPAGYVAVSPVLRPTPIAALAAHSTGNLVALSGQKQVVLLDTASGKFDRALQFPEGDVTALQFTQDGQWLIAAGGVAGLSGRVVGFDVASGERVFELGDENDTVLALDISLDKQMVAVGGPAKVVRVYDVRSGGVLQTLRKHTDWVLSVKFSDDGLLLASGDRFGGLFVWNPTNGEEFHALRGHVGPIHGLNWDGGSETLVSAGEDATIRTWNMHHGTLTSAWDAGVGPVLSMTSTAGRIYASGRNKVLAGWQGPELALGTFATEDQIDHVVVDGAGQMVAAEASGVLYVVDSQFTESYRLSLPTSDEAAIALVARTEAAAKLFTESMEARRSLAAKSTTDNKEIAKADNADSLEPTAIAALPQRLESESDVATTATTATLAATDMAGSSSALASIQLQMKVLQESQTALDKMAAETDEAVDAAVATLAKLHAMRESLKLQQQHQAALLHDLQKQLSADEARQRPMAASASK